MSAVFARPSVWRRLRPVLLGFDLPLLLMVLALAGLGMVTKIGRASCRERV